MRAGGFAEKAQRGDDPPLRPCWRHCPRCLRIHRGTVVNRSRVREAHPLFKGGAEVVLHDGTRLDPSRRSRAGTRAVIELR